MSSALAAYLAVEETQRPQRGHAAKQWECVVGDIGIIENQLLQLQAPVQQLTNVPDDGSTVKRV